jgi:16S rRNA (cytidine1402-2'-O)-methyltransferase
MPGTLYLVATPIGNLQDISLRAIDVLRAVDVIACEDTRHTRKLLNHFGISGRVLSYHEHNERERADELGCLLADGGSVAVVSDAGTPVICDPGFNIVQTAREIGAAVVPVPGPVAFVCAAIASGLAVDSLFFGGFLPTKKGERQKRLAEVRQIPATLLFYEAPHRLARSLADCLEVLGDRRAAVARELTKLHEEIVAESLSALAARFAGQKVKGEIVLVIERASSGRVRIRAATTETLSTRVDQLQAAGLDRKTALKKAAKEYGLSKSEAYRRTQVKSKK